jgi:hypothetical protein
MYVSVGRPALTSNGFQTRLRKLQTLIGVFLLVQKTCSPLRGCRLSASTVSLGSQVRRLAVVLGEPTPSLVSVPFTRSMRASKSTPSRRSASASPLRIIHECLRRLSKERAMNFVLDVPTPDITKLEIYPHPPPSWSCPPPVYPNKASPTATTRAVILLGRVSTS